MGVVKENRFLYIVKGVTKGGFIYRVFFRLEQAFLVVLDDLLVSGGKELAKGSDFLLAWDMRIGVGTLPVSVDQLFWDMGLHSGKFIAQQLLGDHAVGYIP